MIDLEELRRLTTALRQQRFDTNNFQTPPETCDYMVSLLPSSAQRILEPTPGRGNLVAAIRQSGRDAITYPSYEEIDWSQPIDAVCGNPPFSPAKRGYEILYDCMERCDEIVMLLPWYLLTNSDRRAADLQRFGLRSVTNLGRRTFPRVRCVTAVYQLSRGYRGPTYLRPSILMNLVPAGAKFICADE